MPDLRILPRFTANALGFAIDIPDEYWVPVGYDDTSDPLDRMALSRPLTISGTPVHLMAALVERDYDGTLCLANCAMHEEVLNPILQQLKGAVPDVTLIQGREYVLYLHPSAE